jgi:hypothetical protein
MNDIQQKSDQMLQLPPADEALPIVDQLSKCLSVSRDCVASNEEIFEVWRGLPRQLGRIPEEQRNLFLMRMCVAVSVGLFDGAINNVWNAVIVNLRQQLSNFGKSAAHSVLGDSFSDNQLDSLRDSELLTICGQLNIISEEGVFALSQCREMRNRFSAAHPSEAHIDDTDFMNFLSRCIRYGLQTEQQGNGIDFSKFLSAVSGNQLTTDGIQRLADEAKETFPIQREMIIKILFSIYCDPSSAESKRSNALAICQCLANELRDDRVATELLTDYHGAMLGNEKKASAARNFFEKTGTVSLLPDSEQVAAYSRACKNLMAAHEGMDNFYNEEPFAERLASLSATGQVPADVQREYVRTVMACFVGNTYGTACSAECYYKSMIKEFSPAEIKIMFEIPYEETQNDYLQYLICNCARCSEKFSEAIGLIQTSSSSAYTVQLKERWERDHRTKSE